MISTIKLVTFDNLNLEGMYSETTSRDRILIFIPGMEGVYKNTTLINRMFKELPLNNIAVISAGHRGSDSLQSINNIPIGTQYEIFEDCIYDIDAWIDKAKELGYKEILLMGHSLGSSKAAYYASIKTEKINELIFLSPSDMLGLVNDPEGLEDHKLLYPEAKKLVESKKGMTLLSHKLWNTYVLSAQTYVNLFSENSKDAIFNYWNPKLGWKIVNSIKVPVLAITGTKDDGICPVIDPKEAVILLEKELINSPKVKTEVYENAYHDFLGFEDQIIKDILNFN